jgi:hypothetical protein
MRKLRGLKRYYKRLETENDLNKMSWLDFDDPNISLNNWHFHFDRRGLGDNCYRRRKPHLDKLFRHFGILEKETKKLKKEFQLYAVLLDNNSYSDALFLNSPCHKNEFPWMYNDLSNKGTLTNTDLSNYINDLEGFEKKYGVAGASFCVLFKKNIGVKPH